MSPARSAPPCPASPRGAAIPRAGRSTLLLLLALATPALGAPTPNPVPDPDTEVAQRHFRGGSKLYERQQYEAAAQEFLRAREAKPLPAFDFNIARCYDRLGRWSEAIRYYDLYLAATPRPADASDIEARLVTLRARVPKPDPTPPITSPPAPTLPLPEPIAAAAASAPAAPPPPADAVPSGRARIGAAIGLAAVAVAAAGVGAGLVGSVPAELSALEPVCRGRQCTAADWGHIEARANAGYALLAVGGAAAIADLVAWTLYARRERRPAARAAWIVPLGLGAAVGGSF